MPRKLLSSILFFAALAAQAQQQNPLSTIQDVLFKADGARFSGTLLIRWNTFDANNLGTVVQQSRTVQIVNGNLQIQLAPNATAQPPANVYTVAYQSDGREQFTEIWAVPVSTTRLTVPQVRIGTVSSGSGGGSAGNLTPIPQSNVIGLLSDLAQRPTKGPGFGTNAVAVINSNGQMDTVVGVLGDCVFVDGTTGPCGGTVPTFIDAEIPAGTMNGSNTTFTLQNPPTGTSLALYRNGIYLTAGSDYTLSGTTITFINNAQPQAQDTLTASYRVDALANIGQLNQSPGNIGLAQVICSAPGAATTSTDWTNLGGCDIPAASIRTGDRFEIRFSYSRTGTTSQWDASVEWGTVTAINRHAGAADTGFTGRVESAVTAEGAQISVQSWGTALAFLPGMVTSGPQDGLRVNFRARLTSGSDTVRLSNYTVLRYPGN